MLKKREYRLANWQQAAIFSPFEHTALWGGVATGKSFSGAQFSIRHLINMPNVMGFIGANTWDQLNQSTLRELFTWMDNYRIKYVINQRPPKQWNAKLKFPSYRNILSVYTPKGVANAFVRVLSDPDALRGIQFSWYHLDETRDTPHDTHDVLLSRMRESKYRRGLITSTTNGEDWSYQRFGKARKGQRLYGSIHVRTIESVKAGIIPQEYYDTLTASYSELMIAQELDALHVNVHGGRAYYAASEFNRRVRAPWGDVVPNRNYPLIIGCDFNFDPAPHVWMVGQLGIDPLTKLPGIHWFSQISANRASTPDMARKLVLMFPGFFYRVFGDRSGARATTSNAGRFDYYQIQEVFEEFRCQYSIDQDQGNNPLVRNRVENMNRMFKNGLGEIRQTYNPQNCPLFDMDTKQVGWKQTNMKGQGKLDDGGNKSLTHASDGAGYAVWKLFPPSSKNHKIVMPTASPMIRSW